jgi:hypothetical protein
MILEALVILVIFLDRSNIGHIGPHCAQVAHAMTSFTLVLTLFLKPK